MELKSIPLPDTEETEEPLKEKKNKGELPTFEGKKDKDEETDFTEINPFWKGGALGAPGVNVVSPDSWDASWFKNATTDAAINALTDMAGYVLPEGWKVDLDLLEKGIGHRLRQMNATPEEAAAALLMAPRQLDKGARRPTSLLHDILMGKTQRDDFRDWVRRYRDDARRRHVKT